MVFVNGSLLNIGQISISPNDRNGDNMSISIVPDDLDATGAYVDEFYGVFFTEGTGIVWGSEDDLKEITITENNDDFIEGTFFFTATNIRNDEIKIFTEGRFRARK